MPSTLVNGNKIRGSGSNYRLTSPPGVEDWQQGLQKQINKVQSMAQNAVKPKAPPPGMVTLPAKAPALNVPGPGTNRPVVGSGMVTSSKDGPHTAGFRGGIELAPNKIGDGLGSIFSDNNQQIKGQATQQQIIDAQIQNPNSVFYNPEKDPSAIKRKKAEEELSKTKRQQQQERGVAPTEEGTDVYGNKTYLHQGQRYRVGADGRVYKQVGEGFQEITGNNAALMRDFLTAGNMTHEQRVNAIAQGTPVQKSQEEQSLQEKYPWMDQGTSAGVTPQNNLANTTTPRTATSTSNNGIGTSVSGLSGGTPTTGAGSVAAAQAATPGSPPANPTTYATNANASGGHLAGTPYEGLNGSTTVKNKYGGPDITFDQIKAATNWDYPMIQEFLNSGGTIGFDDEIRFHTAGDKDYWEADTLTESTSGQGDAAGFYATYRDKVTGNINNQKTQESTARTEQDFKEAEAAIRNSVDWTNVDKTFDDLMQKQQAVNARNKALTLRSMQERGARGGLSVNQMMGMNTETGYAYDTEASKQEAAARLAREGTKLQLQIDQNKQLADLYKQRWQVSNDANERSRLMQETARLQEDMNFKQMRLQAIIQEANSPSLGGMIARAGIAVGGAVAGFFTAGAGWAATAGILGASAAGQVAVNALDKSGSQGVTLPTMYPPGYGPAASPSQMNSAVETTRRYGSINLNG